MQKMYALSIGDVLEIFNTLRKVMATSFYFP